MKIFRRFWLVLAVCLLSGGMAQAQVLRILPLGDSITSSFSPYNSYRRALYHKLTEAGYLVDFVGSQWGVGGSAASNPDFDQHHEGHAGWHADDAERAIDSIARSTLPDLVLLDLGANDVEQGEDNASTVEELRHIIQGLRAVKPDVIVLIAQPTPVPIHNKKLSKLSSLISRMAREENTDESPVHVVNLKSGFSLKKDTFDGEHPDESGEEKIAERWFQKIREVVP